ncbi:chloride channel protein [Arenicella chitinivorans]|uniref:Chloride channel protein n=1 Tax=Arenicella chitinivorans TaxID=1329800 RepID=A0A918VTD0_9GAMM|nr:chloride channel protein [Arenicella chitinivorans]GHA21398.1 chloride channel protein [Arenicella chitinivorans]
MRKPGFAELIPGFLRLGYQRFLEAQQVRLASQVEGLPMLALLGLVCGLISGGIIILFRLAVDSSSASLLPSGTPEGFDSLSGTTRLLLCLAGGLIVGVVLQLLKARARDVGVVHVLERLDYHQGHLPIRNAIVQFVVGAIALVSGQSVGREGPSVHLGATGGSVLGRMLRIPNNGVRILVGCGVAAAISAAFNTPLAGVIFAMEVVIMEYTVIGFTPVILAAVSSATLTRVIFGDDTAFSVPGMATAALIELPVVALLGALVGCLAAAFTHLTLFTNSLFTRQPIWRRMLLAGLLTGLIAFWVPHIMGTGYTSIDALLLAELSLGFILILLAAKFTATSLSIGLGMPAGLIGPILLIGASAGAAIGVIMNSLGWGTAEAGFYTILGMAAMMAATLQAPLAALIYLLELTTSEAIILPGMTAVITASLVTRVVFGKSSIYRHLMLSRGLDYRNSPLSKALRRIGVASVMDREILQQERIMSALDAETLLSKEPRWILLRDAKGSRKNSVLPATDLARHLNELQHAKPVPNPEEMILDLYKIPAKRLDTAAITIVATLQEAHEKMLSEQCDVLYITGAHGPSRERIYGVVTREHIESSYRV